MPTERVARRVGARRLARSRYKDQILAAPLKKVCAECQTKPCVLTAVKAVKITGGPVGRFVQTQTKFRGETEKRS